MIDFKKTQACIILLTWIEFGRQVINKKKICHLPKNVGWKTKKFLRKF